MRKAILFTGLLLTFWLGVFKIDVSAQTETSSNEDSSNSSLWRITKNGELEGYLVGSIHLMKSNAYPLDPVFNKAFTRSNLTVFELNFDQLRSQVLTLQRQLGMSEDGKPLQETLPTETYNKLQSVANRIGLPLAGLQAMEPWLAAQVVTGKLIQESEYDPNSGIDRHFFEKAKEADQTRIALETPKEQLKIFDELSKETQVKFLHHSLAQSERMIQQLDQIVATWEQGEITRLKQIVLNPMQNNFPEVYQTVIVERNQQWMVEIQQILEEQGKRPLIVVGAAHLPGNQGLIQQLRDQEYTIKQL